MSKWINTVNGEYFSLHWSKTKWRVEEMKDGSLIPSTRGFADGPQTIAYEMPMVDKLVSTKMEDEGYGWGSWGLTAESIRRQASLKNMSGQEVRNRLVDAHEEILRQVVKEAKQDGRDGIARAIQRLLPEVKKKLVWKKVK